MTDPLALAVAFTLGAALAAACFVPHWRRDANLIAHLAAELEAAERDVRAAGGSRRCPPRGDRVDLGRPWHSRHTRRPVTTDPHPGVDLLAEWGFIATDRPRLPGMAA